MAWLKKLNFFAVEYSGIPIGRRQNLKTRWRATGFSPKKILNMSLYALSIDGGQNSENTWKIL
jgi:hypothetical protein